LEAADFQDNHLGWKTYIIFPPWIFFEAMVMFFFWPETKGRTLEELDEIFSAKNPVKESLRLKKVVVASTGEYVVKGEIQQSRKHI
jgi:Sugar (and other) transporter